MKMLCSVQLSEHRYKTPEGYLVCKDCIIARTGKQTYLKAEIGRDDGSDEEYIDIDRKPNEVFSEKTMASFEGKPLTIEHPSESVSPENYKTLSVGNVHNVHRGKFEGQDVMYADINVYDAEAINLIESGEMVELSCGYDCDITEGPNPEQVNIRGNHVALCEQGRAGIARIQDSKKEKKEWGVKPIIKDAVGRGTLIQEFGRYGEQYKIVKIDGNVMYCEEVVTKKNTLFKRDKENIDWAVINKKQLNDMVNDWYGKMTEEEAREEFKKHPRIGKGLLFPHKNGKDYPVKPRTMAQIKAALRKYYNLSVVENPQTDKEYKYVDGTQGISDANGNIYAYFLDKNGYAHTFVIADYDDYIDELRPFEDSESVKDVEEKIKPNDYSDEFTKKELDDFVAKLYADPGTDSFPGNNPMRKKKIFLDPNKKDEFMKSLPEEAEVMADEFDHEFEDGRYLVYWEVYYWDVNDAIDKATDDINSAIAALQYTSDLETLKKIGNQIATALNEGKITVDQYKRFYKIYKENEARLLAKEKSKPKKVKDSSFLKWVEENYHITPEQYDELLYFEQQEIIKEYKAYLLEQDVVQDSFAPLFVISLPGGAWLGEDDRPTQEQEKAKKFATEEEADEYRKVFCNGKVAKIHEPKVVSDSLDITNEKENIKALLDEKHIKYTKIDDAWGSITIDFDDRRELRKAAKLLLKKYDIELFEDELYIAVYDKFEDEHDIELKDSAWSGYNLLKGKPAQDFKQYLRDRGMEFEPSENGEYVHFEVKNADEDVDKEIKAIIDHYTKVGLMDSYSKRFYINAIKSLKEKLEKLEKNELLDANQKDYQAQKANMIKTIKSQIEEYEKKLDAID